MLINIYLQKFKSICIWIILVSKIVWQVHLMVFLFLKKILDSEYLCKFYKILWRVF